MWAFLNQFNALAWKNYKLKRRAWSVLLLELMVPTLIIFALAQIKALLKPEVIETFLPPGAVTEVGSFRDLFTSTCSTDNLVWKCGYRLERNPDATCNWGNAWTTMTPSELDALCQRSYIAVAPATPSTSSAAYNAANDFVTWSNTNNDTRLVSSELNITSFVLFESESAILDLFNSQEYSFSGDVYSSAVIFNEGSPSWDYTVRLNKTFIAGGEELTNPTTSDNSIVDNSLRSMQDYPEFGDNGGYAPPFHELWRKNGYMQLTNAINTFITTEACRSAGTCSSSEEYATNAEYLLPFPNERYETTGFWAAIGFVFALWLIIVLLYPVSNTISSLVREKENKLREGMMMMALRSDALWVSWWFNFMCLYLPLSLLLTLVGASLFSNSDRGLIFMYFLLFFLSATSYAIFISTFFTNSRTASIVGSLVFFGGFFIYVGFIGSDPSNSTITLACLHPAAAFTFATLAFAEYEDTGIGVTQYTWHSSDENNITFKECLDMLIIDSVYLLVLAWYIDKIWPSEFGTQEPWYFPLLPSYWRRCFGMPLTRHGDDRDTSVNNSFKAKVEEVGENLMAQIPAGECVDVRNLYKEFDTPMGGKKVAVDNLNITMFSGQITALLGHNGAGKTTAISMLTGLISPDAGTAIIEGLDINENIDEIRRNLGVCPQHDVLFPDLTVVEHLIMFASFKGVPSSKISGEVEAMVQAVGLTEKRNNYSKELSGGQKRKLSVGIAFIGGSRVVFLDEPTSGMDPYSRRFTWNVIRQYREGRTIVLTTHFMDEADLLGDRIAIMGDGRLICCGSSLYLKNSYGVGYSLTLEKKDSNNFDSEAMSRLIRKHIDQALLLTDVGTEMAWQLPFSSSAHFPDLFEEFDKCMDTLGLESYGMSVTTLEEVFIKITRTTHTAATAQEGRDAAKRGSVSPKSISADVNDPDCIQKTASSEGAVFLAPESAVAGNVEMSKLETGNGNMVATEHQTIMHDFAKVPEEQHLTYFANHMIALLNKRALYFIRDKKAWMFTFIIPFLFLLGGLLIMKYTYPSTYEPLLAMSNHMYNNGINTDYLPTPYVNAEESSTTTFDTEDVDSGTYRTYFDRSAAVVGESTSILAAIDDVSNFPLIDAAPSSGATSFLNLSSTSFNDRSDYAAMMIGSYYLLSTESKENAYAIGTNYTAIYAVPALQMIMASATANYLDSSQTISTSFHPLPETKREDDIFSNYNQDLAVTFITLALPFVPAAFITYIVREKEVKAKHQQMVSGVGVTAYWLSTYLWDNISFVVTIFLFVALVAGPVFGEDTPTLGGDGNSQELGCFIGLFFLFGLSMTGFTYLLSYIFRTPSMAQIAMIFICFILGLVLSIVGIVLRILPDTREYYEDYIQYSLCVFPPFALADGLHNMALITVWANYEKGGKPYEPTDWRITGLHMMMMGWESVVYLGAVIVIELIGSLPSTQRLSECRFGAPLPSVDQSLKDDDVLEQEEDLRNGTVNKDNSVILVEDLKKMYRGGKFAVRGVSLGIPNGECFGLLGINGAGKSSTLSMLSGEFAPSDGQAYLAGLDLFTDIHQCRRKIGYCPQFDALFEHLTAREHLQLYARIKGIVEADIDRVVDAKINEMGLTEYADRFAGTFSGGNKRKLSVAIAMIGEPSIVFLDEPSTGMDPVARRFMWDVISDIVTKREKCSLILTTHSMEECEALCTRIGIMVGGVMRCLGSAQRLRSKYGKGYQIEIGVELPAQDDIVGFCGDIRKSLGKPEISEQQLNDEVVTEADIKASFTSLGKEQWIERLTPTGTGSDLVSACSGTGSASLKHFASWFILEGYFDAIHEFLTATFTSYIVHERQPTKLRIEVPSELPTGGKRLLSSMFKALEGSKTQLHIKDYSMAQTSLEQIFNFFAQQQEEEQGSAGALSASVDNKEQ